MAVACENLTELKTLCSDWHVAYVNRPRVGSSVELPRVTICVVTYNSERWIINFLRHLSQLQYPSEKLSINFVDNGSSDSSVSKIKQFIKSKLKKYRDLKVFEQSNLGYGAGNDVAIEASEDEFVLVLNVDTELQPRSLLRAIHVAIKDDTKVACWEFRQTPYEHPKYYDPVTLLTNWVSHACVLIRRSAYVSVGGYERAIFMYGEDVEISYRFREQGWKLRYIPIAFIKHHVILDDADLRPDQVSGSVSSNILLRYRFGNFLDIVAGEFYVYRTLWKTIGTSDRSQWKRAKSIIRRNRSYFFMQRKNTFKMKFPKNRLQYGKHRSGFDVKNEACFENHGDPPLVSVIILADNLTCSEFHDTLISVFNQTYEKTELIIIGNYNSDEESALSKSLEIYDRDIKFIPLSDDVTLTEDDMVVSGEFFMFLEMNILLFSDHIETLMSVLQRHGDGTCANSLVWTSEAQKGFKFGLEPHLNTKTHYRVSPFKAALFRKRVKENADIIDLCTEQEHFDERIESGKFANKILKIHKTTLLFKIPQ